MSDARSNVLHILLETAKFYLEDADDQETRNEWAKEIKRILKAQKKEGS